MFNCEHLVALFKCTNGRSDLLVGEKYQQMCECLCCPYWLIDYSWRAHLVDPTGFGALVQVVVTLKELKKIWISNCFYEKLNWSSCQNWLDGTLTRFVQQRALSQNNWKLPPLRNPRPSCFWWPKMEYHFLKRHTYLHDTRLHTAKTETHMNKRY